MKCDKIIIVRWIIMLGDKIKRLREDKRMTQQELADI